jgi:hypothetical protein
MEKLTAAEQSEMERSLRATVEEILKTDPHNFGTYLLGHIEADLAVHEVQKDIKQKKDFYKRKTELMRFEYFASILIKKP